MGSATAEVGPAVFIREQHRDLLTYFNSPECRPIAGCQDIRYDPDGFLYYTRFAHITSLQAQEEQFVRISHSGQTGTIFSASTRIPTLEMKIIPLKRGIESGIRAMTEIINDTKEGKQKKLSSIIGRAQTLLEVYALDFDSARLRGFGEVAQETTDLLQKSRLDPKRILDEEMARITAWLLKGSSGQDSRQRDNRLISLMALSAAHQHAHEKMKEISPTVLKYTAMRQALIFQRTRERKFFDEAVNWLRPHALAADVVFKYPEKPVANWGTEKAILSHVSYILRQPVVNPYKKSGQKAAAIIDEIATFLAANERQKIKDMGLFDGAFNIINKTFAGHASIYQHAKPDERSLGDLPKQLRAYQEQKIVDAVVE